MVKPGAEQDSTAKADEQDEDYSELEYAQPDERKRDKAKEAVETIAVEGRAASTKAQ